MSLKARLLTLSIKEQIYITIILLNIFCILVVLLLGCPLSYEFLKEDYNQKKLFFLNKYKEYIDSCFYFQNFCLLQYEEMIRRMEKQAWHYHQSIYSYQNFTFFDNYFEVVLFYNDTRDKDITSEKVNNNSKVFFFNYITEENIKKLQFGRYGFEINNMFQVLEFTYGLMYYLYQQFSNTLFSHDIYDFFRIPEYKVPIMKTPFFINANSSILLCHNGSRIHKLLLDTQKDSSYIDNEKLTLYFDTMIDKYFENVISQFQYYFFQDLGFFKHMFNITYNEIANSLDKPLNSSDPAELYAFAQLMVGYISTIDYGNSQLFSLTAGYAGFNDYYYSEIDLIDNYLYFINKRLSNFFDSIFIPLHFGNNTIITPELCFIFKLKQKGYQIDNNTINDLYKEIKKGNSTIENCFYEQNFLNLELEINDILLLNFSTFLKIQNLYYKGIINIPYANDNYPLYFIKYSYPSYNVLKDFRSEHLIINQVDFYFFISLKEPIKYIEHCFQILQNCFNLIIISILYIWFFCLFINLLIYSKIINDITDPIIKLQEAVESSSINDENIFKYKNDDIINELFNTTKELLNGQIDNNEQGLKDFNILSIPKDQQNIIDENIYKKNLIINNDIMNNLINKQQNMMDFSKNIQYSDPNYDKIEQKETKINKLKKKNIFSAKLSEEKYDSLMNMNINSLENNNINDKNIKNKSLVDKENEPYVKLFKISEFLNYYRKKVEPNNILIIGNNSIIDDSKMSKMVSRNTKINNSLKKNTNINKSINKKNDLSENSSNDNNETIFINMLDEDNMGYLWYMEAKKRNNKSFNYNISDEYKELFMDIKDNYKYNLDVKK